jgi:ADP-ribose pyrophosphatase YjhB (NUDIX family)
MSNKINYNIEDSNEYLSDATYRFVTDIIPIACVDMIPVDNNGDTVRFGTIIRATGREAGKIALIGGRVQKDEPLNVAMGRHMSVSLGNDKFSMYPENEIDRPFYIAQYNHAERMDGHLFDPTKHSISMTYLVTIPEPDLSLVGNEARSFQWIEIDELPDEGAFNQHLVLRKAAQFITSRC